MTETTARELKLKVDSGIYPLEAIQAAAYTFSDRVYIRIARNGGGKEVSLSLKQKSGGTDLAAISDEFHNELLHEALRHRVSQANKKIREFIVTKALVSAQVPSALPPAAQAQTPEEECPECAAEAAAAAKASAAQPAAPVDAELEKEIEKLLSEIEKSGPGGDDPLGVAVPWEKKFGAQAAGTPKKGAEKPGAKPAAAAAAAKRPAPKKKGKRSK
ncbi:MAG: His-Xaa-Ser system protein HxsD [Elusimicrobia bacterium]|nr:His-Xaa-Ser system protein HxsD [Elusimicrobiota bacterium]